MCICTLTNSRFEILHIIFRHLHHSNLHILLCFHKHEIIMPILHQTKPITITMATNLIPLYKLNLDLLFLYSSLPTWLCQAVTHKPIISLHLPPLVSLSPLDPAPELGSSPIRLRVTPKRSAMAADRAANHLG